MMTHLVPLAAAVVERRGGMLIHGAIEVAEESEHVWSSKPRTALFLSAMRHFAQGLQARGWPLHYVHLDDEGNRGALAAELEAATAAHRPQRLVMTHPGDWRVWRGIEGVSERTGVPTDEQCERAESHREAFAGMVPKDITFTTVDGVTRFRVDDKVYSFASDRAAATAQLKTLQ